MEWNLIDLHNDVYDNLEDDRWLLIYKVPEEIIAGGDYSVSYPKNMANSFAATYEYDVDNQDDIDEMFEHLMYRPMMIEVGKLEKTSVQIAANPLEMRASSARSLARGFIDELKNRDYKIVESPIRNISSISASITIQSIWDLVKSDMSMRIDRGKINSIKQRSREMRDLTMAKKMDVAFRINSVIDGNLGLVK